MNICFLLPSYPHQPMGGFRVVYEYANYLTKRGHGVTILHAQQLSGDPPAPWPAPLRNAWRRVLRARRSSAPPQVDWQEIDPRVKMVFLRDYPTSDLVPDGDAIFATAWKTAEYVSEYPSCKGAKCYLIQGWETWMGQENQVKATWMLPLSKITVSRWLYNKGLDMGARDIFHIPNGLDHSRYYVAERMEDREPSVLAVYSSSKVKAAVDAVKALEMLHEWFPKVPATMFGPYEKRPPLPEWIKYEGNLSQERITQIYNQHSIFLNSSLSEGWALPPAEAMACGCAFVGTDSGGCTDYAVHGETALLSAPGDPEALFRSLSRVVEDGILRRSLQRAGNARIKEFTWENSGQAMEAWVKATVEVAITDRSD